MPASGNVLLDTSVIIPYFRGDETVRTSLREYATLYLPQPVLGELYCAPICRANRNAHWRKSRTCSKPSC